MLPRVLEPELMDTAEDAAEYDTMDHSAVNAQFVTDLLAALSDWSLQRPVNATSALDSPPTQILDLGAGTAQIPIELARRHANARITAIDAAPSMLALARQNVTAANLNDRIELVVADAKSLPFASAAFPVVISNSIVHHIAEPRSVLAEAIRVCEPGGLLFHRDLARPTDELQLQRIVTQYAADATPYQRKLFSDSLRAALSLEEIRELVADLGFSRDTAKMTSDRHWTWIATC
jgi:ubiquinone/menaquinone biosynthesis C-methylase UbiE